MPFSLDPQPKEDEIECARCGALIYYGLTRCPECGVNLYEPEDELEDTPEADLYRPSIFTRIKDFFKKLTGKPYTAEEVFGSALDQAVYYQELLTRVGGDHQVVERLIQFERRLAPEENRQTWLQNALERWERDNRSPTSGGS